MQKQYIIRKYIVASSAKEALKKERTQPADECWVDEKWMAESIVQGFRYPEPKKKR